MTVQIIVWGIYIGIVAAGLMSVYDKRYLGKFVRGLLRHEAYTPEKAMTLSELGLDKMFMLKHAITKSSVFKSIVYEKDDEVVIKEDSAIPVFHDKLDFTKARFYIPYELRIRAAMKFEKKGSSVVLVIISAIFFFIIALLLSNYADLLIELAKNFLSAASEK